MDRLFADTGSSDLALPPGGSTFKDPEGIPGNKDDKAPKNASKLPEITNKTHLRRAIRTYGGGKRLKAHIVKRAKAIGASSMLPEGWVSAEEIIVEVEEKVKLPETFTSFLVLEGDVPQAIVLEAIEGQAEGTLRVKMPFYVGNSITKPPHIPGKVYFPTSILAETVAEGKKQIAAGKQPLTVYARHQHAESSNYLPIGGITDMVQEGHIGYVTLEIEPTTLGKDAQILLQAKPPKLNAVSLRSGPKRFELEEVKVNGEHMYRPTKLLLDGVDFAPDAPAMPTYGLEILTAEATVEKESEIIKKKEVSQQVDEITLEAVRAKPEIVEEIEKPLLERLSAEMTKTKNLTAEIATLKEKDARNELNDYAKEMAAKHPQKEEAEKLFLELAATCKTKEEFAAKLLPHFVNATASIKTVTAESIEDKIKKLFPATPSQSLTQETEDEEEVDDKVERVGALTVPN